MAIPGLGSDYRPTGAGIAAGHQTTKTHTRIHHLGLDRRDALMVENMFRADPALARQFVYGPPTDADPADVLFVNGDDAAAMATLGELRRRRPELTAILVSDRPADGSDFPVIVRPLDYRDSARFLQAITAAEISQQANATGTASQLRVLVVDDSFPARQYLKVKLAELAGPALQLHIDLADSAETALAAVNSHAYDLAFVDVIMPGMDGYAFCRLLKQKGGTRVAMLTGRSAPVDFQKGKDAGCDHYLPKPPNELDMRSVLRLTSLRKATGTG